MYAHKPKLEVFSESSSENSDEDYVVEKQKPKKVVRKKVVVQ